MSDLVILYSQRTGVGGASTTAATNYPGTNVLDGPRGRYYRSSSTALTTSNVDFDLVTTHQPQYAVWAGINRMVSRDSADITVNVLGSASGSYTSPETKTDTVGTADLIGTNNEDFVLETTFATAFRYFRMQVVTTDSVQHTYSKAWVGNYLDLGVDPARPKRINRTGKDEVLVYQPHVFDLEWKGVSDANQESFVENVLNFPGSPIFLYTKAAASTDSALNGNRLVHCMVQRTSFRKVAPNSNNISCKFIELT